MDNLYHNNDFPEDNRSVNDSPVEELRIII